MLDLEQEADFTASQLSNPERLMIELRSKDAKPSTPAATAADSESAARPEPRKFEPPPVQHEPQPAAKALPSPPVLAAVSRPVRVAPGASPRKLPGPPTPVATPAATAP